MGDLERCRKQQRVRVVEIQHCSIFSCSSQKASKTGLPENTEYKHERGNNTSQGGKTTSHACGQGIACSTSCRGRHAGDAIGCHCAQDEFWAVLFRPPGAAAIFFKVEASKLCITLVFTMTLSGLYLALVRMDHFPSFLLRSRKS